MTYTHLTTNELVMIEAYYQEGKTVCAIAKSLGRARQTIYNVISFLKTEVLWPAKDPTHQPSTRVYSILSSIRLEPRCDKRNPS